MRDEFFEHQSTVSDLLGQTERFLNSPLPVKVTTIGDLVTITNPRLITAAKQAATLQRTLLMLEDRSR